MKNKIQLKDREWNKLLEKIEKEDVILIIGDELSMVNVQGKQILLRDYLLNQLVYALNDGETDTSKLLKREDVTSFSDISYESMKI